LADQHRLQAANFGDHTVGMILKIRLSQARQALFGVDPQPNPTWWNLDDFQCVIFMCPFKLELLVRAFLGRI
jgi:hypothetical protein